MFYPGIWKRAGPGQASELLGSAVGPADTSLPFPRCSHDSCYLGATGLEQLPVQGGDLLNPEQLINLLAPEARGCVLCSGFCQIPLVVFDSLLLPPPPSHYA